MFFGICHLSFFNFFFSIILNLIKQCSTSCGDGLQYRSAVCMDDQGASIPSFNCRGDPKTDVRACVPANDPCPSYQYRLGPLSTVSDNDNKETLLLYATINCRLKGAIASSTLMKELFDSSCTTTAIISYRPYIVKEIGVIRPP